MREMKDSGIEWIGEIPKNWKTSKLKYIGKYTNGYAFKPEDWGDTGRRIIRIQDLTGSNNNPNYYSGIIDEKYYVNKGDILVSWAATLDAFIWEKEDSLLNQHIFKAEPNLELVDHSFFYWMIKEAMKNMNNDNKHGIFMQHVTLGVFGDYSVPLPPISIQKKISYFLDKKCAQIDSIIEKQQQIIEKLKEYKLSVITEAVTKGLNTDVKIKDSGIDWIEYIPATWEVAKLNKCLSTYKGYAFKSDKFSGSGIPVVRVSEIKNGTVLAAEMHIIEMEPEYKNVVLNSGDILMTTVGSNPKVLNSAVGQLARLPEELNGALLNQNAVCLRAKEGINTDFLYYFLTIKRYREHLNLIAHGTANQYSISLAELLDFYMLIPPYEEQCAIADSLNAKTLDIDKTLIDREEAISKLYDYKKSLIFEAVTGKKEV